MPLARKVILLLASETVLLFSYLTSEYMTSEQGYELLIKMLCETHNAEEMALLLNCLLSKNETDDVIDRVRIYHELLNTSHSQRDSASLLGVSITKITRGSANLYDEEIKQFLKQRIKPLF